MRRWARAVNPVPVSVEGIAVPTYYHSPRSVFRALGDVAVRRRLYGLAVLVPPPYMARTWRRLPNRLHATVMRLDTALAGHAPFNRLGDHFVLELERR